MVWRGTRYMGMADDEAGPMSDSDELLQQAIDVVTEVVDSSISPLDARRLVQAIASYIARFNEEIVNHRGPAWDYCQELEKAKPAGEGPWPGDGVLGAWR